MTVQQWLNNNGTYADGLKIYEGFSNHNKNLLRNLKRKKSPVNRQKLIYELKKLDTKPKPKPKIKVKRVVVNAAPTQEQIVQQEVESYTKKQSVWFHQLPEALHPTLLEANNTFKEKCMLKVQLNNQPIDAVEQCNAIQIKISNLTKANALAWSKIDYYLKFRQLPQPPKDPLEDLTGAQLIRKEQTVHSALSRLRKRLKDNTEKLNQTTDKKAINKLKRSIELTESKILTKVELQQKIKRLINGEEA